MADTEVKDTKSKAKTPPDTRGVSPLPFLLLGAVAAASAAYVWYELTIYRENAAPLLATAAVFFWYVGAWYGGRKAAMPRTPDKRAPALDATSASIFITDADGRMLHVNPAAKYLLQEIRIDANSGRVLEALGLGPSPDTDAGFLRLAGKVIRWRCRRMGGAQDRVWQLDDVTEVVKGHAQVQRELSTLRDVFDLLPLGFLSADGEGKIDRCNTTLAEWLGETTASLIGRSLGEFMIDGSDSGELNGVSMGVLTLQPAAGDPFVATLIQTAKMADDGEDAEYTRSLLIRDVALDLNDIADREGVAEDIAADFAEDMVETLAGRVRWLYHDAPVGIAFLDLDGTVTGCNAALERLLSRRQDDLIGTAITDMIAQEDRDDVQGALSKVVMGVGQGAQLDARLSHPDGQELSASLTAAEVTDAEGDSVGLVLHFIDTTEHRNLEIQFTQSQKMQAVGQLAGGVAHDFNNLLTAMIGFADLLLARRGPDDPDFADIMQIKQNANRATNLVRQLLAFSRKQKLEPEIIDVSEALGDLSNLLSRLIGERVALLMEHGRSLGPVLFDKGQFDQIIINLCVNARDAMPDGGTITIATRAVAFDKPTPKGHEILPAGPYVTIAVQDTGTGIAKENLDRIFEPFFSTKEVGAGTGLGLSTVYGIVHQAEGFIFVDSAVGQGTTFTIYLPAQDEAARQAIAEVPTREAASGDLTGQGTVLLVEDEDAVRLFAARALRNKGYEVLEATDGETALDVIANTDATINVIVSDVVMPGMDGHTLVNLARQELPGVKTILMSGYSEDVFRNGPDMDPSIAFLGKPFTLKGLAAKVKDVLEG